MRYIAAKPLVRLTTLLLLVVSVACCVETERYETGAEARDRGAYQLGLLPTLVPPDASDIKVARDTESNTVWVRFYLPLPSWEQNLSPRVTRVGWCKAREGVRQPPFGYGDWHPVLGKRLWYTPEATSVYFLFTGRSQWHGVYVPSTGMCCLFCERLAA